MFGGYIEGGVLFFTSPSTAGIIKVRVLYEEIRYIGLFVYKRGPKIRYHCGLMTRKLGQQIFLKFL